MLSEPLNTNRKFSQNDIPSLIQKIFEKFDTDNNHHLTKLEFPLVIKTLVDLMGAEEPPEDDIFDLFNLLDVNGDETLDRKELSSLLLTFFKVLKEHDVKIFVVRDTNILY